jgi:hypothetical protein
MEVQYARTYYLSNSLDITPYARRYFRFAATRQRNGNRMVAIGNEPMITQEKLRIYEKFNGDMDGFSRGSKPSEWDSITDQDWRLIDHLLQSLIIVQSGSASAEFEAQVRERMIDAAEDESVCERLLYLSEPKSI